MHTTVPTAYRAEWRKTSSTMTFGRRRSGTDLHRVARSGLRAAVSGEVTGGLPVDE